MPRVFYASLKIGVALAVLLVSAGGMARAQDVQTFVDDAVPLPPPDRPAGPLSAGQLTMDDVLKSSRTKQNIKVAPAMPPIGQTPVGSSMQQVLRRATELPPPNPVVTPAAAPVAPPVPLEPLRAPRFVGPTPSPTTVASPVVAAPPYAAEPAPKNIAPPVVDLPKVAPPQIPAPTTEPVRAESKPALENCVAKTTGWTKSCTEAGYPENFKGQIRGETRTSCPDGGMKDVWIANSCAPPENASPQAPAAPLTAPSVPAQQEPAVTAPVAAPMPQPVPPVKPAAPADVKSKIEPVAPSAPAPVQVEKKAEPVTPSVTPATPKPKEAESPATPVIAPAAPSPASAPAPTKADNAPSVDLCGSAAELAAIEAPSKNLCTNNSTASAVEGKGPWSWVCSDSAGHKANCATISPVAPSRVMRPAAVAPVAAPVATPAKPAEIMAACGLAASTPTSVKPKDNLCAVGKASNMSVKAPWSWACVEGRTKSTCTAPHLAEPEHIPVAPVAAPAPKKPAVDGSCGAAANSVVAERPKDKLCDIGTPTIVRGEGPWVWACAGANGGMAATCKADVEPVHAAPPAVQAPATPAAVAPTLKPSVPGPVVNGLCGPANGTVAANRPEEDLCASGRVTSVVGQGPWNWNCIGENGGMTVSCTAMLQPPDPINGACGSANGVSTSAKPKMGLCDAGISSAVSGKGPWTWSCSGINGGSAAGCVAPVAGEDKATNALPSVTNSPDAPTPDSAPSGSITRKSLVTPQLKSKSLEPYTSGGLPFPSSTAKPKAQPADVYPAIETPTPRAIPAETQPQPAVTAPASLGTHPASTGKLLAQDLSSITFEQGSDSLDSPQKSLLSRVADMMQADGNIRITLTAYASNLNSTPREARRLSLSRALAIRDYLAGKDIPNDRVDVRALGANVPSGEPDRVDIRAN